MENLPEKKNEILQQMSMIQLAPIEVEEEPNSAHYMKLSLTGLAALGTAFEPITAAFQTVVFGSGSSGIYRVTVPSGAHLAAFKDGKGYLGSALSNEKNQLAGQSTLNPLICNPTMLFVAAALTGIDKKLDKIQETQQEILNFLVQKDKAELRGNVTFLSDILDHYKYNWDNEKYKSSNYTKVLDIKQAAEAKIIFCREQLMSNNRKKRFLLGSQEVKKLLDKTQSELTDYQLALYLYAFSSFLEIMLLENFESTFLDAVKKKIEDYAFQYREIYSNCYDQIESSSNASVQSHVLKGLSIASRAAGKAIEKVPVISRSQLDETLIETGEKIGTFRSQQNTTSVQMLVDKQSGNIMPFVESIQAVDKLYNHPLEIVFDQENLYIAAEE